MTKKENLPESYPCRECQAGVVHPRFLTYFTWLNNELITVPDFPAWICDLCGRREYDQRALSWLTILLTQNTGHKIKPARKVQHLHRTGESVSPALK